MARAKAWALVLVLPSFAGAIGTLDLLAQVHTLSGYVEDANER